MGEPHFTTPEEPTNATFVPPLNEPARLAVELGGGVVPGFEVEDTLGRGSYGVVYRPRCRRRNWSNS